MAKALEGDYRPEHGCTLTQSLELDDFTQHPSAACAQAMEPVRDTFATLVDPVDHPLPPPTTAHRRPQSNAPALDLRPHLSRITGADLTQVPGLQAPTIPIILAEIGLNRHTGPPDTHCASWVGLCPDPQISGGTVRSTGTRRVHTRARRALRMAAQSRRTSSSYLGAVFRRRRSKLGPAQATTATAPKLAKLIAHMLKEKTPYRARGAEYYMHKEHARQRRQ